MMCCATVLFSTVKLVHVVGWDDLIILLSLVGFGQHTTVIAAQFAIERFFKGSMIQMLGYPAFSLPNISITILVCQLPSSSPRHTVALYSMAILQSCWNPNILNNFSYWFCAYTTFTDVVLAVVPAYPFWNLQMAWSTKVGLIVMMSMTMLSAIITVIKGTYLPLFTDTTDPREVEQNIVIMATYVPTMRPFFIRTWRCSFSTKPGARSRYLAQDPSTYTRRTRSQLKCRSGPISDVALTQFELHGDPFDQTVTGGQAVGANDR
ncbi:hypothetical protein J3E73DRAFT_392032 [Bipolaris maydis]|nr:hypothetical protein J3E73DRAFT_392032 [Bipolaris maydis]